MIRLRIRGKGLQHKQGWGKPTQKPLCKNAQDSELRNSSSNKKVDQPIKGKGREKKKNTLATFATYFQVMENDRDRLMTFFLCWVGPIFQK